MVPVIRELRVAASLTLPHGGGAVVAALVPAMVVKEADRSNDR